MTALWAARSGVREGPARTNEVAPGLLWEGDGGFIYKLTNSTNPINTIFIINKINITKSSPPPFSVCPGIYFCDSFSPLKQMQLNTS